MAVRIPAPLQDIAATAQVRNWVRKKGFPQEVYFESIDRAKVALGVFNLDEIPTSTLAISVVASIDAEGSLLNHVIPLGIGVDDDARWYKICLSAAYVVLNEYFKAVEDGKWPR